MSSEKLQLADVCCHAAKVLFSGLNLKLLAPAGNPLEYALVQSVSSSSSFQVNIPVSNDRKYALLFSATLSDILRLLNDQEFRKHAAERAHNQHVCDFWLREYQSYPANFRTEAISPLLKVGAFLANPYLATILPEPKSSFNLREMMDEGKILLVNLSKGRIGEDTATLRGALLVTSIGIAAFSRADVPEEERRDFYARRIPELYDAQCREHAFRTQEVPGEPDSRAPVPRAD